MKIFPKLVKPGDNNPALCYEFNHQGQNYIIRFAGKPLLLLEVIYKSKWGNRFFKTYNALKNKEPIDQKAKLIMKESIDETNRILGYFVSITDSKNKSPLVIYTSN